MGSLPRCAVPLREVSWKAEKEVPLGTFFIAKGQFPTTNESEHMAVLRVSTCRQLH